MGLVDSINRLARHFNVEIRRADFHDTALVTLRPRGPAVGRVLLSYIIDPFLLPPGGRISNDHHNHWLSLQIAHTFLELGFAVEVISFLNQSFAPSGRYDYFVGTRINFQRLAEALNPDCVKILHLTTAHWLFNNSASLQRTLALQQRRGVALALHKQVEPNWAIECADYCTTNLGNGFNVGTYAYAGKPIFQIPLPTCATYAWPAARDFAASRRRFVWFGSGGLVHKGLDLVLEAFAELPDYRLTVCGPVNREADFEAAYRRELYQLPNIRTLGWVDVEGPQFRQLAAESLGVVFASCAEGGGASVVTCMQAGLVPLVNYESCVAVGDFGVSLDPVDSAGIRQAVVALGERPLGELADRARQTWEHTRSHHDRERYAASYRQVIGEIMSQGRPAPAAGGEA